MGIILCQCSYTTIQNVINYAKNIEKTHLYFSSTFSFLPLLTSCVNSNTFLITQLQFVTTMRLCGTLMINSLVVMPVSLLVSRVELLPHLLQIPILTFHGTEHHRTRCICFGMLLWKTVSVLCQKFRQPSVFTAQWYVLQ